MKLSRDYTTVDVGSKIVFVFGFQDRDDIRIPIHKSLMGRPDCVDVIEGALADAMRTSRYKPKPLMQKMPAKAKEEPVEERTNPPSKRSLRWQDLI